MSQSTRGTCCGHTPGRQRYEITGRSPCVCNCHCVLGLHFAYGPSPVTRTPSKATGQMCPLVIRRAS